MIILGNIFIILSLFILTSQVIVCGGLLLAPLSGIVKGHAIWPEKDEPSLQAKKKNKINVQTTSQLAFRSSMF